jgi:hypothetical protein
VSSVVESMTGGAEYGSAKMVDAIPGCRHAGNNLINIKNTEVAKKPDKKPIHKADISLPVFQFAFAKLPEYHKYDNGKHIR